MTPDEIVKALKLCAGDRCCEGCIEEQSVRHWQIVMRESADLIESLQAQLADARNELCQKCGTYKYAHKGACDGCKWKEMPQ